MVIASFSELKTRLHDLPPKRAVVAAAHDEHTLHPRQGSCFRKPSRWG